MISLSNSLPLHQQVSMVELVQSQLSALQYDWNSLFDDDVWRDLYIHLISNPTAFDDTMLNLKSKHKLSWKRLYTNRYFGFIYEFEDPVNLYVNWLSYIDNDLAWKEDLTYIMAMISYYDIDLFMKLFPTYIDKEISFDNLHKFSYILQHTLIVYAENNRHKDFIPILQFILDAYMCTYNKTNITEEVIVFVYSLTYANNYAPILIDRLFETLEPYAPKPEQWPKLILRLIRKIDYHRVDINDARAVIHYIVYGTPCSFENKAHIMNIYSKDEVKEIFRLLE